MVLEAFEADPTSRRVLFRRVGDQLHVIPETLRSLQPGADRYR